MKPPTHPLIADLNAIDPVPCPCGEARRALLAADNTLCSLHRVTVSADARRHYHRAHTEVYYILEGHGWIELDGVLTPIGPGSAVLIPPGVRHRAVRGERGAMTLLNLVMPPFDAGDEVED
jgi:mannose-6-phosphate isomerase-like protein (cupin superfamily)